MQTKLVLKGLYKSCKGTVALKCFTKGSQISSYHAYCSVLWGASKAQQNPNSWLCNLEVIWHFKGWKASQFVISAFPWGLHGDMEINRVEQKPSSNLYCETEYSTLNFRFYYLKNLFQTCRPSLHSATSFIWPSCSFSILQLFYSSFYSSFYSIL